MCMWTLTRSLTMASFKVFVIYRQLLFHTDAFAKVFLQKCFIFKEIHGKDPDKYSRMQVSDNFKIITLNWIRISKTLMENWWIYKTANKRSRARRINYRGLNELMEMIIILWLHLKHCWFFNVLSLDLKDPFLLSLNTN